MSKKTKRLIATNAPSTPKDKRPSAPRKFWLWGIGLLVLALGGYAIWGKSGKGKSIELKEKSKSDPTLTAKSPRLQLLSPEETGIDFQNLVYEDAKHNVILNINQYNGGGVAVADINNDKLPDLYFVCTNGKNRLYLNQGNFKFKDITDTAGVAGGEGDETSVTAVDANADGWLDLFVCQAGQDESLRATKLYINNHDLSFTDQAEAFGLKDKSPSSGSNFFDYDNDGDLDCFLINHPTDLGHTSRLQVKYGPDGKTLEPELSARDKYDADHFYKNEGGKFVQISKAANVQLIGFGLSVSVTDINTDGWPDVYVCNDYIHPDNLYINNRKGGFTEQIKDYVRHSSITAMGGDMSDFDNDGYVDLFTTDMFPINNYRQKLLNNTNSLSRYNTIVKYGYLKPVSRNVLQRNNGNGTFSDIACMSGVYKSDWSWSCLLSDLDNDGLKDLYIANGYRREVTNRDYIDFLLPEVDKLLAKKTVDVMSYIDRLAEYKVRNLVYQNKGNWQFEDKGGDWMTMPGSWSSGAAYGDFDADGDLDLVVNNMEEPAFIYKNLTREQNSGNYLQAKLQGSPANPFAVGASVLIEYQGLKQYQELNPNHGIFSSVEHLIHFGLGQVPVVDKLSIRWPDGKTQTLTNVSVNQRLELKWTDASGYVMHLMPITPKPPALFSEKNASSLGLSFAHKENVFNDFETWLLNPWSLSDLGPITAQADVNGDGLEDFYVGNGFDSPGSLYLQSAKGTFRSSSVATFERDKGFEDHGGVFFDADGDQDLDLLVLAGGVESVSDTAWQCRLYHNDGKGNFSSTKNLLPTYKDIALRAAAHDYDGDGDMDLFLGGRVSPKKWPLIPRSVVFQNNGGKFTDVSAQVGGAFERCGMVTDLAWHDLNGDSQKELIVVGEWMEISVFQVKNNRLEAVTDQFGLGKTNGLWNRLLVEDLDKDGDLDLITGNLGLNTRFTASPEAPFYCFAKDFDQNGTVDPIVAFSENGKIFPLMQKEVLVRQMPVLKKRFLYSRDYAKATISDLWPQKELDAGLKLQCTQMETCWWENQGGKFVRHALPYQAQISPTQGIICSDFNKDGNLDLLMAGNKYGFEVETNPCDSGNGVLLLGDGKGNFNWMDNLFSGFWAIHEARDLAMLKGAGNKKIILVANNHGGLQAFE